MKSNSTALKCILLLVVGYFNIAAVFLEPDPETPGKLMDPRIPVDMSIETNKQLYSIGWFEVLGTLDQPILGMKPEELANWTSGTRLRNEGSGFLINECLVMTNYHVAYIKSTPENITDHEIKFSVNAYYKGKLARFSSPGKVVAKGSMKLEEDWAIIKLEKPLGEATGSIPILMRENTSPYDENSVTASYFSDKTPEKDRLWWHKKCNTYPSSEMNEVWLTDCANIGGTSGSPIMVKSNKDNAYYAYGMTIGEQKPKLGLIRNPDIDTARNTLLPFSRVFSMEYLVDIMKENPCY